MKGPVSKVSQIVRPWMSLLIVAGLLAMAVGMLDQLVPLQVRVLVNSVFKIKSGHTIDLTAVTVLVGLLACTQLLRIGQRLATEWASTRIGARLLEAGVLHLLSYPMSWFGSKSNHSGALQVRLDRSTRAISDLLKLVLSDILSPTTGLVIATIFMLQTNLTVGLFATAMIPILAFLTTLQARSQNGIRISINQAREEQGIRIIETAEGIEQVKLFGAQSGEARRAGIVADDLADKEYAHHVAMARFDLAKFCVERAGFALVLILSLLAARQPNSDLGLGGVLMLVMLFDRIAEPARHLHRIVDEVNEKWVLAKDYLELLSITPGDIVVPEDQKGDVTFANVTFSYPAAKTTTISDISFECKAGTKVAVIGPSGCGKTTLARLIAGFYTPDIGSVHIGGQCVQPIESAGTRVGMLSQEPYIFQGTIAENIRYGRQNANDQQVRQAANVAGIANYIEALPNSYQTLIGQRGHGLSGGQKQRIALARVVLQDPSIVIFDEPSSSLDPETTRRMYEVVMALFKDRTVFVITHDWGNLDWADLVLELDKGHISTFGSLVDFQSRQNTRRELDLVYGKSTGDCHMTDQSLVTATIQNDTFATS